MYPFPRCIRTECNLNHDADAILLTKRKISNFKKKYKCLQPFLLMNIKSI